MQALYYIYEMLRLIVEVTDHLKIYKEVTNDSKNSVSMYHKENKLVDIDIDIVLVMLYLPVLIKKLALQAATNLRILADLHKADVLLLEVVAQTHVVEVAGHVQQRVAHERVAGRGQDRLHEVLEAGLDRV